jgi:membrane protein DedA with SNARE-associated domain
MEQSFEYIHLLQQYGYIGIFVFLMLGIVGLPLPDEIFMTFLGYLTSIGQLHLFPTYISALLGSTCGITLSYLLGIKLGYPFLRRYGKKIWITPKRLRMTQKLFRKYGNWLLFIGYFIPGVRHVTAYLAGISKLDFLRFALFAYFGAIFWCATFIGLGNLLGENWELVFTFIHKYGMIGLMVVVPIVLLWLGWVWCQKSFNLNNNK